MSYTSIQLGQPEESQEIETSSTNTPGITQRVTIANGSVSSTSSGVSRTTSEDLRAGLEYHAQEWKRTASNSYGLPTQEITDETIVTIGGIEGPVKSFLASGELMKSAQGEYTLSERAPDPSLSEQTEKPSPSLEVKTPEGFNDTLNAAVEPFSDEVIDLGKTRIIEAISQGANSLESIVSEISQASGLEQGEVSERIGTVVKMLETQTVASLNTWGLDPQDRSELFEWAHGSNQGRAMLRDAIQGQLRGDLRGWASVADAWSKANPPSIEALKQAGLPTKQTPSGTVVNLKGEWISLATATKLGWV